MPPTRVQVASVATMARSAPASDVTITVDWTPQRFAAWLDLLHVDAADGATFAHLLRPRDAGTAHAAVTRDDRRRRRG